MSNLHCSVTNAALCPLVLLSSLSLKKYFYKHLHNRSVLEQLSIWSSLSFLVSSVVKPHSMVSSVVKPHSMVSHFWNQFS